MIATILFHMTVSAPLVGSGLVLVALIFRKDCGHGW